MEELTYTRVGDYYIPDLILDEEPEQDVFYGKYGDLRRDYLREYRPKLWMVLVNSGKLADHLKGVERMAVKRMDTLLPQLMAWVGLVNNCRARADEIILADLVYV